MCVDSGVWRTQRGAEGGVLRAARLTLEVSFESAPCLGAGADLGFHLHGRLLASCASVPIARGLARPLRAASHEEQECAERSVGRALSDLHGILRDDNVESEHLCKLPDEVRLPEFNVEQLIEEMQIECREWLSGRRASEEAIDALLDRASCPDERLFLPQVIHQDGNHSCER